MDDLSMDVSLLLPGALVLNESARDALVPFLSKFGQPLELDCEGDPRWFFIQAGTATIEKLAKDAGLTGIECAKPRPL